MAETHFNAFLHVGSKQTTNQQQSMEEEDLEKQRAVAADLEKKMGKNNGRRRRNCVPGTGESVGGAWAPTGRGTGDW